MDGEISCLWTGLHSEVSGRRKSCGPQHEHEKMQPELLRHTLAKWLEQCYINSVESTWRSIKLLL